MKALLKKIVFTGLLTLAFVTLIKVTNAKVSSPVKTIFFNSAFILSASRR